MMLRLPSYSLLMLPVIVGILVRPTQAFLAPSLTTKRSTFLHLSNKEYNPFSTMLGDMASSIFGGNSNSGNLKNNNPNLDVTLLELGTPWAMVRDTLESLQTTDEERSFRDNLAKGYGPASPLHKVRLYDESNKEEDIRVTFYRDSASWCPYCQKVWLTLEAKRIPYRVEKVNMSCYGTKPASFLAIQPGGQIPVATIDGRVYGQSNDIIFALEDLFPDHKSLRPSDEMGAQKLLRLERTIFSVWMQWLTGRGDPARFQTQFVQVLMQVEGVLQAADGPFFMGKDASFVDFQFAPFLERMAASMLFYKGFMMRAPPNTPTDYPALNQWFDAMEQLEAYQLTKSDYYTHCWDLPPQLGGCTYEADGEAFEKAINGERLLDGTRGSWELPLEPHNGGAEPDWTWAYGDDENGAKREAVERISFNYNAIVGFAARGAGRKGMPPFSAPLSDPNAVSNESIQAGIHACLQVMCMKMLHEGADNSSMKAVAQKMVKEGGKEYAQGVVDSLVYLRDRVGVPRDMRLPAARQLRAHLNWAVAAILDIM
jgi:glutathione S-transferase